MSDFSNAEFLTQKYPDLPGSKPVERAVQDNLRKGEKGPTTRGDRVEAYLGRLGEFFKEPEKLESLKYKILDRYVTKFEEIPESYWEAQEEEARRRGEGGDWERATEEQKLEIRKQHADIVLSDQRASLEQWIDYFASADSDYIPREIKYWVFRNVLRLKELVKTQIQKPDGTREEKIEFPKRSKGTVSPFPDINQEALSYVIDALKQRVNRQGIEFGFDISEEERQSFQRLLEKENFATLYAWANEFYSPIPREMLPITEGRWVKYDQGTDPHSLVSSIRARGTGWCTAGESTAKIQLQGGDFYVYYSNNDKGDPEHPRIAIRMDGQGRIAEDPRGIGYKQNLDPYMGEVLEKKLEEFGPIGDEYKKKSSDMRYLTEIDTKTQREESLTKEDLTFLYELDNKIEGFGYQDDPRIRELRNGRNVEEDMPILFECKPSQIAHSASQINADTRAYVGPLTPGIFDQIKTHNLEHAYTSFPEGKIRIERGVKIAPITLSGFETQSSEYNRGVTDKSRQIKSLDYTRSIMKNPDFTTLVNPVELDLVRLHVRDLGIKKDYPTIAEIFAQAEALGLELCPAEVGPQYRLQYTDQPMNEWFYVGMKPVTGSDGDPSVFTLGRRGDGLWLRGYWTVPDDRWHPG
ncbi:MAG: hypothetical protein WD988_00530, partial [Candidatus Curtissbacteria bacterium]